MKLFVLTILLAYAQVTSAAMPGMAVTDGFGVPVEAAIGSPSKVGKIATPLLMTGRVHGHSSLPLWMGARQSAKSFTLM